MSRCYPYPPPGYEKKAQVVDLGLSTKEKKHKNKDKDKDKDKDKKKRRRKDSETNGDVHDKDKRSNKIHRSELANDVLHERNGRVLETKTIVPAVAAAIECPLDRSERDEASRPDNELHQDSTCCQPALYSKEPEANGKVDSRPPLILSRSSGTISSSGVGHTALSRFSFESDNDAVRQRHIPPVPQAENGWSSFDDQEWLFFNSKHVHPKPKVKVEEGGKTSEVWAEVLHLPSVDMYALPYVVPY